MPEEEINFAFDQIGMTDIPEPSIIETSLTDAREALFQAFDSGNFPTSPEKAQKMLDKIDLRVKREQNRRVIGTIEENFLRLQENGFEQEASDFKKLSADQIFPDFGVTEDPSRGSLESLGSFSSSIPSLQESKSEIIENLRLGDETLTENLKRGASARLDQIKGIPGDLQDIGVQVVGQAVPGFQKSQESVNQLFTEVNIRESQRKINEDLAVLDKAFDELSPKEQDFFREEHEARRQNVIGDFPQFVEENRKIFSDRIKELDAEMSAFQIPDDSGAIKTYLADLGGAIRDLIPTIGLSLTGVGAPVALTPIMAKSLGDNYAELTQQYRATPEEAAQIATMFSVGETVLSSLPLKFISSPSGKSAIKKILLSGGSEFSEESATTFIQELVKVKRFDNRYRDLSVTEFLDKLPMQEKLVLLKASGYSGLVGFGAGSGLASVTTAIEKKASQKPDGSVGGKVELESASQITPDEIFKDLFGEKPLTDKEIVDSAVEEATGIPQETDSQKVPKDSQQEGVDTEGLEVEPDEPIKRKLFDSLSQEEQLRAEELKKEITSGTTLTTGIDPKQISNLTKLASLAIKDGAIKFGEFSQNLINTIGESVKPHLKDIYKSLIGDVENASSIEEVDAFNVDEITPFDPEEDTQTREFDPEEDTDTAKFPSPVPASESRSVQPPSAINSVTSSSDQSGNSVEPANPKDLDSQGNLEELEVRLDKSFDRADKLREKRDENFKKSRKITVDKVKFAFVDTKSPIFDRLDRTPEAERIRQVNKLVNYSGAQNQAYLNDINQLVLDPLKKSNIDAKDMGKYMTLVRIRDERSNIKNIGGITGKDAPKLIENMRKRLGDEKFNEMEKARLKFWEVRNKHLLKDLIESQSLSDEMSKKISENDAYVRFDVADFIIKDGTRGSKDLSKIIANQQGSTRDITNPLISTLELDGGLRIWLNKNLATKETVAALKAEGLAFDKPKEGFSPVTHMEKGKPVVNYVEDIIARGLNETNPVDAALFGKILRTVTTPIKRLFTELNPAFWPVAWARDLSKFKRNVPVGITNMASAYIKAFPSAIKGTYTESDPVTNEMLKRGLLIPDYKATFDSDFISPEKGLEESISKISSKDSSISRKVMGSINKLYDYYTNVGRALERSHKIAGFLALQDSNKITDPELFNIIVEQAGSPDFMARGSLADVTNNVFLFSKAIVNDYSANIRAAKKRPAQFAMYGLALAVLPKVLTVAIERGMFGEEWEEWMNTIPERDRANYMVLPLSPKPTYTESGKAVYFRVPVDEATRMFGSLVHSAFGKGTNDEVSTAMGYLSDQIPGVNPVLDVARKSMQFAEGQRVYDPFRNRYIMDKTTFEAIDERGNKSARNKAFAEDIWQSVGGNSIWKFNSEDPADIQSEMEKKFNTPLFGKVMNRFIKVSDRGITERLQAEIATEVKGPKAQQALNVRSAASKFIKRMNILKNGGKEEALTSANLDFTQEENEAIILNPDSFENRIQVLSNKGIPNALFREYENARSEDEKNFILSKMIEKGFNEPDNNKIKTIK